MPDYYEYLFPDPETRNFWKPIRSFFYWAVINQIYVGFALSVVGIPSNLFHLLILSRKSMMTSSTNVILIGIAVADIWLLSFDLYASVFSFWARWPYPPAMCKPPVPLIVKQAELLFRSLNSFSRTGSIWLAVSMALIRALVLKFPLSNTMSRLASTRFGFLCIVFVFVLSLPTAVLTYSQYTVVAFKTWMLPEDCDNLPPNTTATVFTATENDGWFGSEGAIALENVLVGVLAQLIPCVLLPSATVLVTVEMVKQRRKNEGLISKNKSKGGRSTKLVVIMAISFLVALGPNALLSFAQAFTQQSPGIRQTFTYSGVSFKLLLSFNAAIHCLICFLMSSQYRETVNSVLGLKAPNVAQVVRASTTG